MESSVRPPDLEPESVRDTDVLAGWDVAVSEAETASWSVDARPVPVDTIAVLAAAGLGAVAGLFVSPTRRASGASLGALGGAIAAGIARRIWRLKD